MGARVPEEWKDERVLHLTTVEDMFTVLKGKGRGLSEFKKGTQVYVWNKMEKGYSYVLEENPGEGFAAEFKPYATPAEILALGAFGGRYLNDCLLEFPAEWFWHAGMLGKLAPGAPLQGDTGLNYFKVDSRIPLREWKKFGWVPGGKKLTGARAVLSDERRNPDIRGWFQWYCRYWMGRRIPELDKIQIQRWKNFARHFGGIKAACKRGDMACRPRQRQALLHWAWDFRDGHD